MLNKILGVFPIIEVMIRFLYWKSKTVHKIIQRLVSSRKKNPAGKIEKSKNDFSILLGMLASMGVKKGDTIIVHSAYGELKGFGLSPDQVIDALIEFIGPNGNLIMPAIPVLENQPGLLDRFKLSNYVSAPLYDVQKTKCWTGVLAQCLVNKEGAIRSRSPLNSMAVFGPNAKEMVRNDLFSEDSLPCGENSVLALSLKYNAKMLFLGVDEVHSMTMIHVAEDLYINNWPIGNWFWKRPFEIVDGDYHETLMLTERNPFWALFYAERRFSRDLLKQGVVNRQYVGDVSVSICESNRLVDYLGEKNNKGYPYLIPFWFRRERDA
jgi:aminoglycoside 3-N-acetyltransferase